MPSWEHSPDYRLFVRQANNRTFQLTTIHSVDATLVTNAGMNQMRVLLHDPGQRLRNLTDAKGRLHPMQAIQLQLNNRYGQWGVAWTGYIDAIHYIFDVDQGDVVQIMCTGPIKLWEITNTTPQTDYDMAMASMRNVKASSVLTYSCRAVGYPTSMLKIDPVVDSGTGFQDMIQDLNVNPAAQKWTNIITALQANAGIEWFFDEEGKSYWRQAGYLRVPTHGYRPVFEDDVLNADLAESDEGVVTKVAVRFDVSGTYHAGPNNTPGPGNVIAQAPKSMIDHLRMREVVEYIPWLAAGSTGVSVATFLANFLLQQYAANVITGSMTISADPIFRVGTVCEVPSLRGDGSRMLFYISSIAYALQWNGHWTMTLGLTYGRPKGANFPYGLGAQYPLWTAQDQKDYLSDGPSPYALLPTDPHNPQRFITPFTLVQTPGIAARTVQVDPGYLPAGTMISLRTTAGAPVGDTQYTVVNGPQSSTPTIRIGPASGMPSQALVTVVSVGAAHTSGTGTTTGDPGTPAPRDPLKGTGGGQQGPPPRHSLVLPGSGPNLSQRALRVALTKMDADAGPYHYILGDAGWDGANWDCSGLVNWAFYQVGFTLPGYAQGVHGPIAADQYTYFQGIGARQIPTANAQVGDLLFHSDLGHIGWCYTVGPGALSYAACAPGVGLRAFTIASEAEGGFPLCLDMSGVTGR